MNKTITITIIVSTDRMLNGLPKLRDEWDAYNVGLDCLDAPEFIPAGGCFKYKDNVFQRCNVRSM